MGRGLAHPHRDVAPSAEGIAENLRWCVKQKLPPPVEVNRKKIRNIFSKILDVFWEAGFSESRVILKYQLQA